MRVLKSSKDPIRPVKKQPSSSDDADFLQRWMKSDDYKRSTGGRAMLSTDYGIETLPEYERIGFAADDLRYVDAIEGRPDLGGVSRPTPEASFIDLRQPVRSTEVMSEYPQIATHELSHTTGEPVTLTNELGLVDRSTKVDSRFLPSDRLPVRYISYLNPETGEMTPGEVRQMEVKGDFDTKVNTGTLLPFNKAAKEAKLFEYFRSGLIDAEEVLKNTDDFPN